MEKIFCYSLLIILFVSNFQINAQIISRKWEKVIILDEKEIYLDTSSIKQENNIISALIITFYKQPKFIAEVNKEIVYKKTQTLFDTLSRKVNIVGNLYYDKNLKIIGDAFKPLQIVKENNVYLIDTSKTYSALFEKCFSYIKKQKKENKLFDDNLISSKISNTETKNRDTSIENTKINIETNPKGDEENYNFNSERLVYKTIFTDGKKFCLQISSWKEKWKAEREVNKLKNMGHNAFIVKVNIPGKGIWYRVRIGYFLTLEEAEKYNNKMMESKK